ncbi:hypothetical protein Pyn_00889 [Prunus yedoensis var. nudiflora]|uniref:Uncharacterized protein n=1 Tax=Prunus yedoensis var. nudiflora TaxID=2094558 RepID=A0A314YG00_PRUYE|nr:hypothetical protein Pyn_00889 [Prunus yedoensis var. nudiflora]
MDGFPRRRPSPDEDYFLHVCAVEKASQYQVEYEYPEVLLWAKEEPEVSGLFLSASVAGKVAGEQPNVSEVVEGSLVLCNWMLGGGLRGREAESFGGFVTVDWEGGDLSEDEEGQLEVIRALLLKDRDVTELLLVSSLRESGLRDLIPEGSMDAMGVDRNDPRALEMLLAKGVGASG